MKYINNYKVFELHPYRALKIFETLDNLCEVGLYNETNAYQCGIKKEEWVKVQNFYSPTSAHKYKEVREEVERRVNSWNSGEPASRNISCYSKYNWI